MLGRIIEVISGDSLDTYFENNVFIPLGMSETRFQVLSEDVHRFASNYVPNPSNARLHLLDDAGKSRYLKPPRVLSGGGGLVSTMADYYRFIDALRRGGNVDGQRIIGRKTLEYMTSNHLPGGADLTEHGRALFSETAYDGVGFGLGFSVVIDPSKANILCQKDEYGWGGAASTAFWVDPVEDIAVIFLTQLMPSSTYPIRPELKALVYQALE